MNSSSTDPAPEAYAVRQERHVSAGQDRGGVRLAMGKAASRYWLCLVVFCAAALMLDLNGYQLQNPDEGRYAEASREMVELGDWVVPHFGYVERLNKPPLVYWVTATGFRLFGAAEWVARLGSALAGLAGALVVFFLGRSMFGAEAGAASAVVLLSSLWYVVLSRTVTPDILLCLFITLALAAFWWGHQSGCWRQYALFGASCAAATLTKGPVGLALPGMVIAIYLTVTRRWGRVDGRKLGISAGLYLLLAAPWFLTVQARYPGFLRYLLVGENLERYAGKYHSDVPPYFYLPVIVLGLFPWSLPWLATAGRDAKALLSREGRAAGDPPRQFLWIWFITILGFFSLGKGKLPTYVLPCFPALALIIGRDWAPAAASESLAAAGRWQRRVIGWLAALLFGMSGLLLLAAISYHRLAPEQRRVVGGWLVGALAAGALLSLLGLRRGTRHAAFAPIALTGALLIVGLVKSAAVILAAEDVASLAREVARRARPEDRIILCSAEKPTSFRFYLGRELGSARRVIELPPPDRPLTEATPSPRAADTEEASTRAATQELLALARQGGGLFCLIKKPVYNAIRPELGAARCDTILGENRNYLLITNRVGNG